MARKTAEAPASYPKGKRMAGDEGYVLRVMKMYREGGSIRHIALELGRSYGAIHRTLTMNGATLRSRGGNTRGKK